MAYTKTTWQNDVPPALNATNLNKIETGIEEAHTGLDGKVGSTVFTTITQVTQAEYDALAPPDPNTLYVVV